MHLPSYITEILYLLFSKITPDDDCTKGISNTQLFTTQSQLLTTLREKAFENIVEKGENAGNQHFLLFPQCFLPFSKQISIFGIHMYHVVCKCSQFGLV